MDFPKATRSNNVDLGEFIALFSALRAADSRRTDGKVRQSWRLRCGRSPGFDLRTDEPPASTREYEQDNEFTELEGEKCGLMFRVRI